MVENIERMGCGHCGNKTFSVYQAHDRTQLHIECIKCKSVSVVSFPTLAPKIDIAWGEGSEGVLCVFGGD